MKTQHLWMGMFAAFALAGCAAATDYQPCVGDNCVGGSGLVDGSVPVTPDLAMPAGPEKGFGEACTDKSQCASDICLFAGIGGVCTRLCDTNPCPDGFGCYGVLGVIDPGIVAEVCVPDGNQLCTPCLHDTECSLTSNDLCLPAPAGGSFCARDCTTVACPSGFSCTDVTLTSGGTTFKQCLPTTGACDCTAASAGQMRACSITTALGTMCQGQRTCQGATGWTSCAAPSTNDVPDAEYADENCDGIDGDVTQGIFVATTGIDSASCGLVYTAPCRTVGHALTRAVQSSRPNVYVQAGTYNEVVVLQAGKNIYGGYDANWSRKSRVQPGHTVTIVGGLDAAEGQFLTLRAHDLVAPATLADLVVVGPTPSAINAGRSTYALHAKSSTVTLTRVTVQAGAATVGTPGTSGQNAEILAATAAMSGGIGGGASQEIDLCDDSTRGAPGPSGINASCANTSGGSGGTGGTMDHNCTCLFGICACLSSGDCRAEDGTSGTNGAQAIAGSGFGGGGGTGASTCGGGQPGQPGRVLNGAAGAIAQAGAVVGLYFVTGAGGSGVAGANGGGGGGGGAAGGCDEGTVPLQNSSGAGGGGGGAGGCAALSGGGGGGGGGSSFAVFAISATVQIADSIVTGGSGASGGDGGAGGTGQSGGGPGPGGNHNGGAGQNGSTGGVGAHGGHGGGGAGGAGGSTYGLYSANGAIYTITNVTISAGTAGAGGQGGQSALSAPFFERDGNAGPAGPIGAAAKCNFNDPSCF